MNLSAEQARKVRREYEQVTEHLGKTLPLDLNYRVRPKLKVARAQEYFSQGVGRRVGLIHRCLDNVFRIFPPGLEKPLSRENLNDVVINLHAYVINIYGLLDNVAWTYVFEKNVLDEIKGGRTAVGLFSERTQKYLPTALVAYLNSKTIKDWFNVHAKNYRDALAHRIPLYVPPFSVTKSNEKKYKELERKIWESIESHNFEETARLTEEQSLLGRVCAVYIHSYSDSEVSSPVILHPQMICDAMTVIELLEKVTLDITGEVKQPYKFSSDSKQG